MIISKDSNNNWAPVATGNGQFIGTKAAFDAVKDDLPDNTVAYTTDDGVELCPRSSSRITVVNDAGNLANSAASATEYTASDSGMCVAHVVKSYSGNTCTLSVNDVIIDSFPYYSPTTIGSDNCVSEITLTAFVRKGDKIKVYCDGNGDKYALANILIQTISWYK